jgi:8-oxo-dGTP diphosphatase
MPVEPLRVIAGAILDDRRLPLVSKRAAPRVFSLPGGKPEPGEAPLATLARELGEEVGLVLLAAEPLALVSDEAALERTPMEMQVFPATVQGAVTPRAEIEAVAWVGAGGESPGTLAPAIRNHVLPELAARRLIA